MGACGAANSGHRLGSALACLDQVDWLARVAFGKAERQRSILTEAGLVQAILKEARRLRDQVGLAVGSADFRRRLRASTAIDWSRMSDKAIEEAVEEVADLVSGLPSGFAKGVELVLNEEGARVVDQTHRGLAERHRSFRVDPSWAQTNEQAVEALSETTSLFFSEEYERQAERFTDRARGVVASGLEDGLGSEDIGEELRREFADTAIHRSYWDTVAAVHVSRSRSFSSAATYAENGVTKYEIVAIMDNRTTPICQELNGKTFEVKAALDQFDKIEDVKTLDQLKRTSPMLRLRAGRPVLPSGEPMPSTVEALTAAGVLMPPYHYRCFTGDTRVQGRALVVLRSLYAGEVIEVATEGGRRVTLTANHPVLTPQGFVPAGALEHGQDLLCDGQDARSGPVRSGDHLDEEHEPPTLEELFRTLRERGGVAAIDRVADDLHGDALFGEGKIEVVTVDRELTRRLQAQAAEGRREPVFVTSRRAPGPALLGRSGPSSNLIWTVGAGGRRSPCGSALAAERGAPVGMLAAPQPLQPLCLGPAAKLDPRLFQNPHDGRDADAVLARQLLRQGPSQVALDKVVEIRRKPLRGHVYDLQTETGFTVAGGVFASNCRTTVVPVID